MTKTPAAILFDLDGTLLDSAPDLAGAANDLRASLGLAPLPVSELRPMVGAGARGMLQVALSLMPQDADFAAQRDAFLRIYARRMTHFTTVFPLVPPMLQILQSKHIPWGIVTNKAEWLARPLVQTFPDFACSGALVGGDTTAHAKPHPAPLLEAARRMRVPPEACWYVGDDLRDIQAGQAAGMKTVAAAWGYLGLGEPIEKWQADFTIQSPQGLLELLGIT
jgi:N-acetyl-D-muramate 6-phosphate phosphatase